MSGCIASWRRGREWRRTRAWSRRNREKRRQPARPRARCCRRCLMLLTSTRKGQDSFFSALYPCLFFYFVPNLLMPRLSYRLLNFFLFLGPSARVLLPCHHLLIAGLLLPCSLSTDSLLRTVCWAIRLAEEVVKSKVLPSRATLRREYPLAQTNAK